MLNGKQSIKSSSLLNFNSPYSESKKLDLLVIQSSVWYSDGRMEYNSAEDAAMIRNSLSVDPEVTPHTPTPSPSMIDLAVDFCGLKLVISG
jgi:hypothetical protein